MMLSKFVRIQLVIFSILTVIGLVVMATQYVQLPALFGIGQYRVTVQLPSTGGLYTNANVAFRGTNVGKVEDVVLTEDGVDAKLSISKNYDIPADVDAAVKSVSAIGEQYVDLIPRNDSEPYLSNGDVIPVDRTTTPQDVGVMLDQADELVKSISNTKLRMVVDESFKAFNGAGPDLQRLIDSARLFVQEANNNVDATKTLIDQAEGLLDTQVVTSDDIRAWTKNLVTFSNQLRASDPQIRNLLEKSPDAAAQANGLFQDLQPTLPLLLANLVSVGEVTTIYHKSIEQVLVVYPPLVTALLTAAMKGPIDDGAIVNFALELNDPPPCTTGFLPADQWRPPNETSTPNTPPDLFCRVAQDDPTVVRGARNYPCMEFPGKRAASPEECRSAAGYVPLGNNPPSGPPQDPSVPSYTTAPASFGGSANVPATARPYDPTTGKYTGPDGRLYSQPGLASGGTPREDTTWQTMMTRQQG
ncbi:MCE family protein [Prescottella agglutinans]|uniref:Phospholipid/cholesterol/gamma-HCH transport system substrate-binding protein n=1 Tax=Prescottella agglutinans TaxID=1644129 RepID=A0ABT6MJU6_9NOCA|nr:MCE family protein [Prescottella agglutinans]MDH6284485.1 phospholipid/cholesterol/gamma-HCH transport system substrate-binding protein [Prescottella agglutinans]